MPWFEKKYLRTATAVTTVSDFFRMQIETNIKRKPFYIIPNGFDDSALKIGHEAPPEKETLAIGFAGTIYPWHPWRSFLFALDQYLEKNPYAPFELRFFGINIEGEVRLFINENAPQLKKKAKFYHRMLPSELFPHLAKNHAFLLFNDYSIMGTKIYDYMALGRKVLLCYGNDAQACELKKKFFHVKELGGESQELQKEMLDKTNSGIIVENQDQLFQVFDQFLEEFRTHGKVLCQSIGVEQYARRKQTAKLAQIIHQTIKCQADE